jgi:hypothetical protein
VKVVLLDTNTLLLYIVGSFARERIGARRVEQFDDDDFVRLSDILGVARRHISVPGVLIEASNLLGSGEQQLFPNAVGALAAYCRIVSEVYEPSKSLIASPLYEKLGLTDTAIFRLAKRGVTVLTTDHELHGRLTAKGVEAINLLHFKTPK